MKKKLLIAGPLGIDADYLAILSRAQSLGYALPSIGQQAKQNNFLLSLKAAGIWSLLDVLYVFATNGDSDFATLNWKAPTLYQCLKVNSPTFTANQGFNGNGTTSYLNTQWVPGAVGVNYTQNNCSYVIGVNTNQGALSQYICGAANGGTDSSLQTNRGGDGVPVYAINGSGGATATGIAAGSTGFWHIKRTASNAVAIFRNGAENANAATASGARPVVSFYLGGKNNGGVLQLPNAKQFAMFSAGASLSGLESLYYNAWNTYFASL